VLYVALVIIGLWNVLPNTDLAYVLGSLTGAILVILLFAAAIAFAAASLGSLDAARNRSFSRLSR